MILTKYLNLILTHLVFVHTSTSNNKTVKEICSKEIQRIVLQLYENILLFTKKNEKGMLYRQDIEWRKITPKETIDDYDKHLFLSLKKYKYNDQYHDIIIDFGYEIHIVLEITCCHNLRFREMRKSRYSISNSDEQMRKRLAKKITDRLFPIAQPDDLGSVNPITDGSASKKEQNFFEELSLELFVLNYRDYCDENKERFVNMHNNDLWALVLAESESVFNTSNNFKEFYSSLINKRHPFHEIIGNLYQKTMVSQKTLQADIKFYKCIVEPITRFYKHLTILKHMGEENNSTNCYAIEFEYKINTETTFDINEVYKILDCIALEAYVEILDETEHNKFGLCRVRVIFLDSNNENAEKIIINLKNETKIREVYAPKAYGLQYQNQLYKYLGVYQTEDKLGILDFLVKENWKWFKPVRFHKGSKNFGIYELIALWIKYNKKILGSIGVCTYEYRPKTNRGRRLYIFDFFIIELVADLLEQPWMDLYELWLCIEDIVKFVTTTKNCIGKFPFKRHDKGNIYETAIQNEDRRAAFSDFYRSQDNINTVAENVLIILDYESESIAKFLQDLDKLNEKERDFFTLRPNATTVVRMEEKAKKHDISIDESRYLMVYERYRLPSNRHRDKWFERIPRKERLYCDVSLSMAICNQAG